MLIELTASSVGCPQKEADNTLSFKFESLLTSILRFTTDDVWPVGAEVDADADGFLNTPFVLSVQSNTVAVSVLTRLIQTRETVFSLTTGVLTRTTTPMSNPFGDPLFSFRTLEASVSTETSSFLPGTTWIFSFMSKIIKLDSAANALAESLTVLWKSLVSFITTLWTFS